MSTPFHTDPPRERRATPPVRVIWEHRVLQWPQDDQLQLRVPVVGWFTAPAFGYLVGAALQRRWQAGGLAGMRVRAVAGHCDERRARRVLTLLVTFAEPPARRGGVAGARFARDLMTAVQQAQEGERAARASAGPLRPTLAPMKPASWRSATR